MKLSFIVSNGNWNGKHTRKFSDGNATNVCVALVEFFFKTRWTEAVGLAIDPKRKENGYN